jgi:hypothetical protein
VHGVRERCDRTQLLVAVEVAALDQQNGCFEHRLALPQPHQRRSLGRRGRDVAGLQDVRDEAERGCRRRGDVAPRPPVGT